MRSPWVLAAVITADNNKKPLASSTEIAAPAEQFRTRTVFNPMTTPTPP